MRAPTFALAASLLMCLTPAGALAADADALAPEESLRQALRAAGRDPARADAAADAPTLRAAILDLYALVGAAPTPLGLARLDAALADLPADVEAPAARLLAAMNEAARLRHEAFAQVSVEDARFAHEATLRAAPPTPEEEARLADIAARIDADKMATAGDLALRAVAQARLDLAAADAAGVAFVDPLGAVQIAGDGDDVHAADRTLLIDLGGDDEHANNAGATMPDFVIEAFPGCITTGGLDCTPLHPSRNSLALQSVFGRPCSFDATQAPFIGLAYAADADRHAQEQLQEQNLPALQRFLASPGGPTMQRAQQLAASPAPRLDCLPHDGDVEGWAEDFHTRGILTDGDEHVVAVALDLGGSDRYAPPREFNDINDGDNAAGCDTRWMGEEGKLWARNLTAGSAFAGVGILWDTDGDDFYGGRSLTQGVGHVGGVGVLVDEGQGSDEYVGVRLAQGAAIFASVGVLFDEGGHDRYALENDVAFFNEFEHFIGCDASTRDGQGRANFNGVAALVDLAGDDTYFVQQHAPEVPGASRDDPTTTQGSTGTRLNVGPSPINGAAALGFGLLYDGAGADSYSRPGRADGATDASGTFVDRA